MKNVRNVFNEEQLRLLSDIGFELANDYDYSDDELIALNDAIGDEISASFIENDEPGKDTKRWESIMDTYLEKIDPPNK